ncbi:unnamed protein product, partial [Rotaria magnacalcarata]
VQDAPRSGRSSTSANEQTIDALRKIIEDDPHSTYQQIENTLETGAIVNTSWYVNTCLPQICKAISERREIRGLRGLIFHDDNARPHRARITNELLL